MKRAITMAAVAATTIAVSAGVATGTAQAAPAPAAASPSTLAVNGAAALVAARNAGGAQKFDAALHCYINANAWRIATPAALATALAGLPASVQVLKDAGALSN